MLGQLYDRALGGEQCWVRHEGGQLRRLPVQHWLGGDGSDAHFDAAIVGLCAGRTIDLGCGPGRLVARLVQLGIDALGVDQSEAAVALARRNGTPVLLADIFSPLPHTGSWETVLLADGSVGLAGDPWRVLRRAAELLAPGGRCLVEVDPGTSGVRVDWLRLESGHSAGPWFRWASVGVDAVAAVADRAGLRFSAIGQLGERVVATLCRS